MWKWETFVSKSILTGISVVTIAVFPYSWSCMGLSVALSQIHELCPNNVISFKEAVMIVVSAYKYYYLEAIVILVH